MDSVSVEGHFFYWSYVILTIADSAMETQVLIDTYHIFSKKKKKKTYNFVALLSRNICSFTGRSTA